MTLTRKRTNLVALKQNMEENLLILLFGKITHQPLPSKDSPCHELHHKKPKTLTSYQPNSCSDTISNQKR